jgi:putative ABC transport system permease protein
VFKLTLKGLFAHKLRFALTALAVMLGVSFLSGTLVLTDTIKRTFDDLFADVNAGTDAYVRSSEKLDSQFGTIRPRIPASLVPEIGQVDGVAEQDGTPVVQGQLQFSAQLVDKKGEPIGDPGQGAPTFGFIWDGFPQLSPWTLDAGRPPRADDQVVIDKGSADKGGFEVGDEVQVLTQAAPATYEITGIAKFGTADNPGGASVALFTQAQAQEVARAENEFDGIAVAGDDGVSQAELARRIRATIDLPKIQVITGETLTKENQDEIQQNLAFFNTFLLIFALVALFVGCFIIFNTFSIIVAQRTKEMALLRAIGASGRQVVASVLGEALVVGFVASAAGLVAGIVLASGLKALLAGFGIDIPAGGTVLNTRTIVVALVVGTVVTLLSSVFPARKAARVPPVAAMRDVSTDRTGNSGVRIVIGLVVTALGVLSLAAGLVNGEISLVGVGAIVVFLGVAFLGPVIARPVSDLIGWPLKKFRGITGELARENASRNPKRTASTAAALMIGVALVALITILASSTKESIGATIDQAFRADYIVAPKAGGFGGSGFSPELATAVKALPEIETATGLRFGAAELDGNGKFLIAADPKALNQLFDLEPSNPTAFENLGPDQIAVSERIADEKGWKIGDTITARFPSGGTTELTVGAKFGVGQQEGLSDYFVSLDAFTQNFPEQFDAQVYAKLKPGVSLAAGKRAMDEVVKPYANAEVEDQAEFKAKQEASIDQFVNLIYALLFLAVIIAGIGIANTLALSIVERTREIGLLRAVGMTRSQLKSTIRWEAVIIAMLGTVLGLVIGLVFGWAIVQALSDQGINKFAPPGPQLIIIVLIAALLAVLFAYFPARRAAKLDVLRAISTE